MKLKGHVASVRTRIAALGALIFFSCQAFAQTGDEVADGGWKQHRENVEKLLELMGIPEQVNKAAANFKIIYSAEVTQDNPDPNLRKIIDAYQADMNRLVDSVLSWQAIKPNYLNVYTIQFTPDEVTELSGFLQTPAGQKLISSQSVASEQLAGITQHLVEADLALPLKQLSTQLGEALVKIQGTKQ